MDPSYTIFRLTIKTILSTYFKVTVYQPPNELYTVGDIKYAIESQKGINSKLQSLYFKNEELQDHDTLEFKNIKDGSVLRLFVKHQTGTQLNFQGLDYNVAFCADVTNNFLKANAEVDSSENKYILAFYEGTPTLYVAKSDEDGNECIYSAFTGAENDALEIFDYLLKVAQIANRKMISDPIVMAVVKETTKEVAKNIKIQKEKIMDKCTDEHEKEKFLDVVLSEAIKNPKKPAKKVYMSNFITLHLPIQASRPEMIPQRKCLPQYTCSEIKLGSHHFLSHPIITRRDLLSKSTVLIDILPNIKEFTTFGSSNSKCIVQLPAIHKELNGCSNIFSKSRPKLKSPNEGLSIEEIIQRLNEKKCDDKENKIDKGIISTPYCAQCKKKIIVGLEITCRCNKIFCIKHRYPETHNCDFDYKEDGKSFLKKTNPKISPDKLPKI